MMDTHHAGIILLNLLDLDLLDLYQKVDYLHDLNYLYAYPHSHAYLQSENLFVELLVDYY